MQVWIVGVAVGILILFIGREFVTWYWKINELIGKTDDQTKILKAIHQELTVISSKLDS